MLIHKHPDQSALRALEIWTPHYFKWDASQQQRINRKAIVITIFRGPSVTSEKGRKPFLNPCPYMERFHSWWKMSACEKGFWPKCADIIWRFSTQCLASTCINSSATRLLKKIERNNALLNTIQCKFNLGGTQSLSWGRMIAMDQW